MVIYPNENFDTFVSMGEAESYMRSRLHSGAYTSADNVDKLAAIKTAFRALSELDITLDPDDTDQTKALKTAQCEQALYEIKHDTDNQFQYLMTAGVMMSKKEASRYSERALALLRPYIRAASVSRFR